MPGPDDRGAGASDAAGDAAPPEIFLTPGTLYCGAQPRLVRTVLGSCVALCLIDRNRRGAGMNHYMLPSSPDGENSLRYGDVAIERLRARMAALGCAADDLRAKLFGGAAVLPGGAARRDSVGERNVRLALEWLRRQSVPVVAQRTGGQNGLLIRFHTGSGRVLVRALPSDAAVAQTGMTPTERFDARMTDAEP